MFFVKCSHKIVGFENNIGIFGFIMFQEFYIQF